MRIENSRFKLCFNIRGRFTYCELQRWISVKVCDAVVIKAMVCHKDSIVISACFKNK
jgi:hypothetical protein